MGDFGSERPERGGQPLLTVETKVHGDSKSTKERVLLGWFVEYIYT